MDTEESDMGGLHVTPIAKGLALGTVFYLAWASLGVALEPGFGVQALLTIWTDPSLALMVYTAPLKPPMSAGWALQLVLIYALAIGLVVVDVRGRFSSWKEANL